MRPTTDRSDFRQVDALVVGSVDSVSPASMGVTLNVDAPQSVALNSRTPANFPRVNSYVTIPGEMGSVVGLIESITVEASPFPRRTGLKDFGLIDLPFPLRRLRLTPVGTLVADPSAVGGMGGLSLQRGVSARPSVGDLVLLPTEREIEAILRPIGANPTVAIGTSPIAPEVEIRLDPDLMFGQHLAVLGNTGSGKSCTVAGLLRWSLQAAELDRTERNLTASANARFIVLDPNGEYRRAFGDLETSVVVFEVPPTDTSVEELHIPAWLWNSEEWSALTAAAPQTQRPLLMQALRELRSSASEVLPRDVVAFRVIEDYRRRLSSMIAEGPQAYGGEFKVRQEVGDLFVTLHEELKNHKASLQNGNCAIAELDDAFAAALDVTGRLQNHKSGNYFNSFTHAQIEEINGAVTRILRYLRPAAPGSMSEDSPVRFDVTEIPERLRQISARAGTGNQAASFISTLVMRIETMLTDQRISSLIVPGQSLPLRSHLERFLGDSKYPGRVAVLDLSLVPSDVLHLTIAVLSRLIFEALQRSRRALDRELPTVIVLEEAHRFIRSKSWAGENEPPQMRLCRETFERIAREGRKFGLGLVISSQRPTELSPTVLSQCNSYILHRLVNGADQDTVARAAPDLLGGLLSGLPALPVGGAMLLGAITPIPVLTQISPLPEAQRPRSSNPAFWDVWTDRVQSVPNWAKVSDDWSGGVQATARSAPPDDGQNGETV